MGNILLRLQLQFSSGKCLNRYHGEENLKAQESKVNGFECLVEADEDLEAKLQEESQNRSIDDTQYIRISGLTIQNVPVIIGVFGHLVSLDVSNNYLTDLPWSVVYLKKLTTLNLSQNMLTSLPRTVCYLGSLAKLDITYNFITHLPTEMLNLKELSELEVAGNRHLVSPPLKVVEQGVDAVMQELNKRYNRKDLWENWNKKQPGVVMTLFQICILCIIHCKVEFFSPSYVPPKLKTYLSDCADKETREVMVCKCSICHGYFSNRSHFDIHHCKVK